MKLSLLFKLATVGTLGTSAIAQSQPVTATEFNEFAVDQSQFIAVAVPYNYRRYKLAIIEQIPGQPACWNESGGNPTTVNLLLLNFDHTTSCRKAVDSNGYSLRVNGKDDKVEYTLNLVESNGQLQLVADHQDPNLPNIIMGRTSGLVEAPMKIQLESGWQFTKRLYQGSAIQHIYMSNNPNPQVLDNVATIPAPNNTVPTAPVQTAPVQTATPQSQPVSQQPSTAQTTPPAQTPATTVEGLMNIFTPLSEAVYNTYNSLFVPTNSSAPQPAPTAPNNNGN